MAANQQKSLHEKLFRASVANHNQASFLVKFILDFASFTNFNNLKQGHFLAQQYA